MPTKEEQEEADRKAKEEADRKAAEETSEQEDETQEELSPEELKAKLAEREKQLRAANKEAKERRIALEALEKEKKEREEKELSEKEKAEKRAQEAEARAIKAEKDAEDLKLRQRFESKARELKLVFASEGALEDAFGKLKREEVGDDFAGLEDELKRIVKDHAYYFGKPVEGQNVRDGSTKGRVNQVSITQETINKKRGTIGSL